jgi:dTDP-4-amino-4,6-dideoxygalactose transaminase
MDKRIIGLATVDITDAEIDAVAKVLKSGKISPGSVQREFEDYVATKHGMKYGTFVNSGQSALQLSFEALKYESDYTYKTVICPATTYISTIFAVWNAGLAVHLVDVNPSTYNMDCDLSNVQQSNIICPVNLMGLSANHPDYPRSSRGIAPVVEDNCESVFAPHTGYGDYMCLSFYAAHQITTGSGGMVCTNSIERDKLIKSLCNHGRADSSNLYTADRNESYDKSKKFIFDKVGFSFKMGDYMAALGLVQARRADEIIGAKIKVAHKLLDRLNRYSEFIQLPVKYGNTFMNFPIVVKEGTKDALVKHLNEWQIETRDLMPILNQPIIIQEMQKYIFRMVYDKNNIYRDKYLPVSETLLDTGFYIGCHQGMTDDDIEYVGGVFDAYFQK